MATGIPLRDKAQQIQEEWADRWMTDMVRVTRPGGLIIVENLSFPYCESMEDFGGILPTWWNGAFEEHEHDWKVDRSSLQIGIDRLRHWRYHLAIRKKEKTHNER